MKSFGLFITDERIRFLRYDLDEDDARPRYQAMSLAMKKASGAIIKAASETRYLDRSRILMR